MLHRIEVGGAIFCSILPVVGRVWETEKCYNTIRYPIYEEVRSLKTVLLIMQRASLAQGLMAKVRDAPGIQLCYEPDYAHADISIRSHLATGVLLEVSEDGTHDINFCLTLCARLRELIPHCRLMLMCPERQTETIHCAIEAKRRGEIDDFVFYDVSLDYLSASLQTL